MEKSDHEHQLVAANNNLNDQIILSNNAKDSIQSFT